MFESSRAHHPHPLRGVTPLQEIEIKLRMSTVASAKRLLMQNGFAVTTPRHGERNLLLDTHPPSLRPAGTVLRLRQARGESIITYKGKGDSAGKHKVREELEVQASSWSGTLEILSRLGYTPTFRYDKYRTVYARARERGQAMLDETPMGAFLELEGAARWIDRTAARLGFTEAGYITASYGALWTAHRKAAGLPLTDCIFPTLLPPRRKT